MINLGFCLRFFVNRAPGALMSEMFAWLFNYRIILQIYLIIESKYSLFWLLNVAQVNSCGLDVRAGRVWLTYTPASVNLINDAVKRYHRYIKKYVSGTDIYPHMSILLPHAARISSMMFTLAYLYGNVYMRVGVACTLDDLSDFGHLGEQSTQILPSKMWHW